jgi:hypothetical protein
VSDAPAVSRRQGGGHLLEDPGRSVVRKLARAIDQPPKAAAPKEPGDHVRPTRFAPVVVDGRDVRVLERRDGLRLGLESTDERGIVRTMLVHHPDRDLSADVGLRRPVHNADRVLAHAFEQSVAAQRLPTRIQVGALGEDPFVHPAELRRRVDPQLVGEDLAGSLVGGECFPLATRAVEGEHQLLPEAFAQGMPSGENFELSDHLYEFSQRELRVDPFLEGGEPQVVEPRRLGPERRLGAQIREGRPGPQIERMVEGADGRLRVDRQ